MLLRTAFNPPFLLAVLLLSVRTSISGAFVVQQSRSFAVAPPHRQTSVLLQQRQRTSSSLSVIADAEFDMEEKHKKRKDKNDDQQDETEDAWIPSKLGGFLPNLRRKPIEVTTLQDYKREVVDVNDRLVVVRFYAPWCKACRAVQSPFYKLAKEYNDTVKFVEVPLTKSNGFLHDGLGVPSLPYAHIYHPQAGLVEERSINKKIFGEFKDVLKTYVNGECEIDWDE